jgi:membrane protease YdiL (CAAX protease family)
MTSSHLTDSLPPRPTPRSWPLLAWVVILTVVALILWRSHRGQPESEDEDIVRQMQDRAAMGVPLLFGGRNSPGLYDSLRANQDHLSWPRRLRLVVIAGELEGPDKALAELASAREALARGELQPPTAEQKRLAEILDKLYARYAQKDFSGGLSDAEREQLRQQLGWWGELSLTPAEGSDPQRRQEVLAPAKRVAATVLSYGVLLLLLGLLGVGLLVLMGVLLLLGRLGGGLQTGTSHGGIYAETFALYMVLFVGLGLLLGRVFPAADEWLPLRSGLAALASLAALGWPRLRGIPWRQVRAEIGWTAGRRPGVEPLIGVGTYVAALPLVLIGVLLFALATTIARRLGAPVQQPTHPILGWVVHGGWWVRLQLLIDACILAPLVEETMFRGVLYRHLREAIRGRGSVFASAAVSSVVFAIIHPQGVVFVPVLGALAFTFALAREWRGTLIPPMVAHGITNGLALLVLLLATG